MHRARGELRRYISAISDAIDAVSAHLNALEDPGRMQLQDLLLASEMVADYIRRVLWEDFADE